VRDWSGRAPGILVVGWGFLGAAVGTRLFERGARVSGLTRSVSWRVNASRSLGVEVAIGDAGDRLAVGRSVQGIDHVVFVAGGLDPPTAESRPIDDAVQTLTPLLSTLDVIRGLANVGFTYISSGGTVYGNPSNARATELDPARPLSTYGVSRLTGETYSQMYAATYGITTQIVRCANAYGPGQSHNRPQGAVAVFLSRVAAGLTISIAGRGTAVRDYVHIDDVASAIAQLVMNRVDCGVVNLGSGSGCSVIDLITVVSETVGRSPVVEFSHRRPYDVDTIVLDISKLRSLIPFDPMSLVDGVHRTWASINPG
jgi:UDP-glucose 4-epimerase